MTEKEGSKLHPLASPVEQLAAVLRAQPIEHIQQIARGLPGRSQLAFGQIGLKRLRQRASSIAAVCTIWFTAALALR